MTGPYVLDASTVPDEVGHSWPALGIGSGFSGDCEKRKEIHDNEVVWVLSVGR